MTIAAWCLGIVAGLVALAWLALAVRLAVNCWDQRPVLPISDPLPDYTPEIDAIVAARNEEREIAACVGSLLAQDYPRLRLTVVDDQSTDATGAILDEIAARPENAGRLRVIHGVSRPAGWLGKTWAVRQGCEQATADWLWFVDGDMTLHPRALTTAVHLARRQGADLVSFLPHARCETFWQKSVALFLGNLITHLYLPNRVNDPERPDMALAAGGFLLVRREWYEKVGGHESVRSEVVEDIALGRRVKKAGGRLFVAGAPALASTHMYGDFGEIWRGLRKNAYAGMDYLFHKYVFGVVFGMVMGWAPIAALIAGLIELSRGGPAGWPLVGVGALGWLAQAMAVAPFAMVLRIPVVYAFSLPAGLSLYVAIASASVWHHHRGRILWKDVTYVPRDILRAGPMGPDRADAGSAAGAEPAPSLPTPPRSLR